MEIQSDDNSAAAHSDHHVAEFTVESGVPLSEARKPNQKYPFGRMQVGDSFALTVEQRSRIANAATKFGKDNQMTFAVLKHNGAFRCWRTA